MYAHGASSYKYVNQVGLCIARLIYHFSDERGMESNFDKSVRTGSVYNLLLLLDDSNHRSREQYKKCS